MFQKWPTHQVSLDLELFLKIVSDFCFKWYKCHHLHEFALFWSFLKSAVRQGLSSSVARCQKNCEDFFAHLITSTYKKFLCVCNGFANLWCYLCRNEKWWPMRTICENVSFMKAEEGGGTAGRLQSVFMKAPIKINPGFNELWLARESWLKNGQSA